MGSFRTDDGGIGEILVTRDELAGRIAELGAQLTEDYAGRRPLLVCVLRGAYVFLTDLARACDLPVEIDFMAVSSYGSQTHSSGVVRILKDLDIPIAGRHVLIVEDVIDSGLTLSYLLKNLASRDPASLEICTLLTKPRHQRLRINTRYVGFELRDVFVIGYGLDHGERFRNLPFIAALDQTTVTGSAA